MRKIIFAALAGVLMGAGAAAGQPTISGPLTGNLGPGVFIVVGDCQVPAGQALTIQPGTELLFSGHYFLKVDGHLSAVGTAADSIILRRQFPTNECRHGGIHLNPGSSDSSQLAYVHIDHANNVDFPDCFGGGLLCWDAGVSVSHCTFSHCRAQYGGGAYFIGAQASVTDCAFRENEAVARGGCIYTIQSSLYLARSTFLYNVADLVPGVEIYDNPDCIMEYCEVAHNTATSVAG
ncbi:MAG: hypothetical protein C4524_06070 [Candidatus Zixiibacteriota bacterium]|nr:MAG: hypothetical protein C4524_06070 [candidate division Zixibacteria bacterium]